MFQYCGVITCSAIPPWPTPFSTASSTAPIASISKVHRYVGVSSLPKAQRHELPVPRSPTRAHSPSPPLTPWTILYCLTGITVFMQLVLVSTAQIAATLTPTQSAAWSRDHDHRNR